MPVAARALTLAKQAGTLALLNPAPAVALPDEVVRDVDVIVPNRSEAELHNGKFGRDRGRHLVDRLRATDQGSHRPDARRRRGHG